MKVGPYIEFIVLVMVFGSAILGYDDCAQVQTS